MQKAERLRVILIPILSPDRICRRTRVNPLMSRCTFSRIQAALCLTCLVLLIASPHASAAGPAYGLSSLPTNRPISMGYLNALRSATGGGASYTPSQIATEIAGQNWAGFDAVVHAFAEPLADGQVGEGLGNFSAYQAALLAEAHARGKSVILSIGGAFPERLAAQFATIAADPALRQTFCQNVVNYLQAKGYDGVDIDWEFPDVPSGGRAKMTALMQALHSAVKAAHPNYIVMFGTGPGYYLGSYDFAALHPHTDFFFYFGYDWKNPQNGPMTNPGTTQYTTIDDQLPEASVRGGIQYAVNKGFPAAKIICGLPFYGAANTSWSAVRNVWAGNPAGYFAAIHANSMEVLINGEWFTTPESMKRKMDALLKPASSVLTNQAIVRGIGTWEIGHEHRSNPDLSTAFAQWLAAYPTGTTGASIIREAAPGGGTQARVGFTALPNTAYRVQYSGSLAGPINWSTMPGTATSNAQGQFQIIDPPPLPQQRFYRAVIP